MPVLAAWQKAAGRRAAVVPDTVRDRRAAACALDARPVSAGDVMGILLQGPELERPRAAR